MRLASPEWLLLLPVLLLAAWYWPALRLRQPLRAVCALLLVVALAEPQVRTLGRGLDLWVLVDRSASAAELAARAVPEWQTLLERSRQPSDRIFYVDFADAAVLRSEAQGGVFSGKSDATRTATAMQHALSRMDTARASRLLVLSDGYSTEPLIDVRERLAAQGIALDYRLLIPDSGIDFRAERLRIPERVQPGEPFLIELEVTGEADGELPFEILRDGARIASGSVALREGRGHVRFTDQLRQPGANLYTARIQPEQDAHPGNNQARAWIEVQGGPRLLVVTNYREDPLASALRAQGFEVELAADPSSLHPGRLAGAKAVVLNNVPAHEVPSSFLDALDLFVRVQGGGLLMTGGRHSFGSGGYFNSSVDELLPVSMELRQEHRKLAVAMAIVMDRSGSMAMSAGAGLTKMDLANEGAARSIELLGDMDAITVFAVDSEAHKFVPITTVGPNRAKIIEATRKISSMGGGIYVYTGIKAGWAELQKAQAGTRHMILFSDAADSEEPGRYQELLAEMTKQGASVSVIGLGSERDSDAAFLKDVAALGNGRIFFNTDPAELPALFAQETVSVARSAFLEEPVDVQPAAGWMQMAARPLAWMPAVDGYNLSYLKPEATAAVLSGDEYEAPLVAFWNRGAGRAAAVSFPLAGDFSAKARGWVQYGDFVQTLGRWLIGEETLPGIGLRSRLYGDRLEIDLLHSQDWEERFARTSPRLMVAEGAKDKEQEIQWERLEPGHFRSAIRLEGDRWIRGAVIVGDAVLPFGPVAAGVDPEWAFDRARLQELRDVSKWSGGEERLDLTKIWQAQRRPEFRDIRTWLLVPVLLLFLVDALGTRLGWQWPALALPRRVAALALGRRGVAGRRTRKPEPAPRTGAEKTAPAPPAVEEQERRSRFRQAKQRGLPPD